MIEVNNFERCDSSSSNDTSVPVLIISRFALINGASALDIAAWKRGFCLSNADSKVDPERGRPDIKCNFCELTRLLPLIAGQHFQLHAIELVYFLCTFNLLQRIRQALRLLVRISYSVNTKIREAVNNAINA